MSKMNHKLLHAMLVFTLGGQQVSFVTYPEKHLWLNSSCTNATHCKALQAYQNLLMGRVAQFDTNPVGLGGRLCEKSLGGRLVIGTDSHKNENAFCGFNDGSWIDAGSLSFAALQKPKKP